MTSSSSVRRGYNPRYQESRKWKPTRNARRTKNEKVERESLNVTCLWDEENTNLSQRMCTTITELYNQQKHCNNKKKDTTNKQLNSSAIHSHNARVFILCSREIRMLQVSPHVVVLVALPCHYFDCCQCSHIFTCEPSCDFIIIRHNANPVGCNRPTYLVKNPIQQREQCKQISSRKIEHNGNPRSHDVGLDLAGSTGNDETVAQLVHPIVGKLLNPILSSTDVSRKSSEEDEVTQKLSRAWLLQFPSEQLSEYNKLGSVSWRMMAFDRVWQNFNPFFRPTLMSTQYTVFWCFFLALCMCCAKRGQFKFIVSRSWWCLTMESTSRKNTACLLLKI